MSTKRKIQGAARSRTMRFNVIMASIAAGLPTVVELVEIVRQFLPVLDATMPNLQALVSVQTYQILGLVSAAGNAYYRSRTSKPLEDRAAGGQGGQP